MCLFLFAFCFRCIASMQGCVVAQVTTLTHGLQVGFIGTQCAVVVFRKAQMRRGENDAPPGKPGLGAVHFDASARSRVGAVQATFAFAFTAVASPFKPDEGTDGFPISRILRLINWHRYTAMKSCSRFFVVSK